MTQFLSEQSRKSARALVLTSQDFLANAIGLVLRHGDYVSRAARSPSEAMAILKEWRPHQVIVELDAVGEQFMAHLRCAHGESGLQPAVLGLTRMGDLRTKLAAFDHGVDDVVTVPFSPEDLLVRMLSLNRRAHGRTLTVIPVVELRGMALGIFEREVFAGLFTAHLTSLEQSLLYLFAANPGRVLTRNEIIDTAWGIDHVAESNVVDRHVRNLRAKLRDDWRKPRFIATAQREGYRFVHHEATS